MFGHLVNYSPISFGQQGEMNDEESPSAPASILSVPSFGTLPSVPSIGNEEWCHLQFNAFADASTTSASPISPCFPGYSGSSAGIARSYSTTPLSSASVEIPRTSLPLLPETSLQVQSTEVNLKKHNKFILEDPTMAKVKKDKAMRACTTCFTKRWECSESEVPNRCLHCVGKTSYCKGPIETPRLLDIEWFDATTAALLARHYQLIDFHFESESLGPMQVDLRLEPSSDQEIVSDRQTYSLQIPGLRDDFYFLAESSSLDGVLDAILPADVPLCIAPKSGLYDLSLYECLCRRLYACISLLRRPNECTLDKAYKDDRRAVHMVVGFLCQLNRTASSIFADIFEHVRGCCFANRDRRGTPNLMLILAEHLGHMHKEIRRFVDVKGQFSDLLPLSGLFHNAFQLLDELENLGRGLCPRAFESTFHSPVLDVGRIHLTPCFEPNPYTSTDDAFTLSQHTSFLDILRDLTPHKYPIGDQPLSIMYSNDTLESWQNMDVEDSNLLAGHDSQDGVNNGQDMIIEEHVPFGGVEGLQAEANAMLNPGWTLGLDNLAVTQDTEASVSTDHLHAGILDSIHHSQHGGWEQQPSEVQQAGHGYLQSTVPAYTDVRDSMLTPLHDVMASSQAQPSTSRRSKAANTTASSKSKKRLCSLPTSNPVEVPKRASKRKHMKTVFSRKEPRLTPSRLNHSEDSSALTTHLSSKLALRTDSAAKTTNIKGTISSKQPSDEYPTEQPRANWVAAWEQGRNRRTNLDNAGIVRDMEISDSERRPMSWPHRNPWRKSLDISVAVLTKGFEKLMTERGESFI